MRGSTSAAIKVYNTLHMFILLSQFKKKLKHFSTFCEIPSTKGCLKNILHACTCSEILFRPPMHILTTLFGNGVIRCNKSVVCVELGCFKFYCHVFSTRDDVWSTRSPFSKICAGPFSLTVKYLKKSTGSAAAQVQLAYSKANELVVLCCDFPCAVNNFNILRWTVVAPHSFS